MLILTVKQPIIESREQLLDPLAETANYPTDKPRERMCNEQRKSEKPDSRKRPKNEQPRKDISPRHKSTESRIQMMESRPDAKAEKMAVVC